MYLSEGCEIVLKQTISRNLGLVNGTKGVIKDFVYLPKKNKTITIGVDMPDYLIVEFPNYEGKSCRKDC